MAAGLPQVVDLLFIGDIPSGVMLVNNQRRPHTGTHVVYFTGQSGKTLSIILFIKRCWVCGKAIPTKTKQNKNQDLSL